MEFVGRYLEMSICSLRDRYFLYRFKSYRVEEYYWGVGVVGVGGLFYLLE